MAMVGLFEEHLKTIDTIIGKLQFLLSVASRLPSSPVPDHDSGLPYRFSTEIRQHRRGLTVVFIQSLNKEIKSWMDEKEWIKEMDENVRYGLQGFHKKEVMQILRGLRDAENEKMIENGEYAIHLFNLCDAYLAYGTKKSLLFKVVKMEDEATYVTK
uniref:Uncharacterized protein n=1 Tax=Cannabis sativa TaxID=3483 RepID=A0A803P5K1_CANSA